MSKNYFFLPVEVKDRELDSRILIALKLVENGIPVVIGDRGGCAREIKYIPGSTYFAKSLSIDYVETFQEIKKNNGYVWVLFEEGAFIGREKDAFEEVRSFYPPNMLQFVDYILTYGKSYQNFLITNFNYFNTNNTFVSGNVRFDLHKQKYFQHFSEKVKQIKSKYDRYILINGNFGLANHIYGQEYIINEISSNKDLTPNAISSYLQRIEKKKKSMVSFLEMIKNVAEEFTEFSIIVRPYPGEKLDIYENTLKHYSNISITNEGMANPWIIGAELVIHQDCTTGIESIFAGKPVISYLESYDIEDSFKLAVEMSEATNSSEELILVLNSYLREKKQFQFPEEKKEKLYNQIVNMNEDSAELIVQKVLEFNDKNKTQIYPKDKKKMSLNNFERYIRRKRNLLGWYKRKYFRKDDIYTLNFNGLSKQEVISIFNNFMQIENNLFELDVKKLSINTFLIQKKHKAIA